MIEKMLKIFTLKFNDKIEGFNDEIIYNFLCNKDVISWKSYFFERRNENFWTIILLCLAPNHDNEHSTEEERWITMGQTPNGKILVISHTYRNLEGEEVVRIISARKAKKKEIKQYFERRL